MPRLQQTVADLPIGKEAEAVVLRKGVETVLKVTPVEREPAELKTAELKPWGITARNISLLAARELKRDSRDGVLVTSTRPGGPCGEAKPAVEYEDVKQGGWAAVGALRSGDLIVETAGEKVEDVAGFEALLKKVKAGKPHAVVLHVIRGIHHVFVELEPDWDKAVDLARNGL